MSLHMSGKEMLSAAGDSAMTHAAAKLTCTTPYVSGAESCLETYGNIIEGNAGLRDLLELRLVAPKVHGASHGAHWVAALPTSCPPAGVIMDISYKLQVNTQLIPDHQRPGWSMWLLLSVGWT